MIPHRPSHPRRSLWRCALAGALVTTCLVGLVHASPVPPPPPPPARGEGASLEIRVFPETPVVERAGGQQQLNFEFRLDAVGGPVKLLNVLVRTYDAAGALSRFRQLVPGNYQGNFSDVAVFEGSRFLGSQAFDVRGPIPAGGRVLFFNPWHSFGTDEPLKRLSYTFYYVDDHGKVATSSVDVHPVEARPIVPLRLPVAGRWLVIEGHDYETHHRRIFSPLNAQRYASDFVLLAPDDTFYKGDGTRVTDYVGFGAEVYAPGAGTVVARESTLNDNPVGARDDLSPYGNHVVIDHGHGVASVMAHLMKGSIVVEVGDKVVPGQIVGRVGNSGASDLPHLHFHLQRGLDLQVSRAEGAVALFSRYQRMVGKQPVPVELGSPATGEVVAGELPPANLRTPRHGSPQAGSAATAPKANPAGPEHGLLGSGG
ncbi:MAG: M23 family metallopeptidase [Myxococcota bacterium]